jgi:plasmid maintenance system antidote protein VapI
MGKVTSKHPIRITKLRYHLLGRGSNYMIAAACHIHPSTLSAYTLGTRPISAHHLLSLARYLNKSPEEIVGFMDFSLGEPTE